MILEFVNTTAEIVRIFFDNDLVLYLDPYAVTAIPINGTYASFSLAPNYDSKYGLRNKSMFAVLSKYEICNSSEKVTMHIEKQVNEDKIFRKYVRFAVSEYYLFFRTEYSVVDEARVRKWERKEVILGHIASFFLNLFSYMNILLIGVGVAFGCEYGAAAGITVYLIAFTVYSIVMGLIDVYTDRNSSVTRFMTDEYIRSVFGGV